MKSFSIKNCWLWIIFTELVGVFSGLLSKDGFENFSNVAVKSPLMPPSWLFPVVWTILYGLMGIGICITAQSATADRRHRSINLYLTQVLINFFGPVLFFNAQAYGFALVWLVLLWVLVFWMTILFARSSPSAARLQIPYLLWLTFAIYLNTMVWILN